MSQIHRPHRVTGPGLGRVFLSTVVSLGALVALGVVIYAWNSPEVPSTGEEGSLGRTATASSAERGGAPAPGLAPGARGSEWPGTGATAEPGTDGAVASGPSSAPSTGNSAGRIGDPAAGGAARASDADSADARESAEDVEDLSDIERPVAYADAEAHFRAGDYAGASRYFAAYVEDHGENAWGFYMLGLSRMRAGRPDAAEASFLAALDLDPDHTKSLVNLARVRLDLGRFEDALVPIERALQVAPEDNASHRVHARVLHNLSQPEAAAQAYLSALELDGRDAWSMNNLGLIRIEQEEFTTAVPPLARAVELDSTVAVFRNNLGIALERVGDYSGAVLAYDQALALDPSYGRAQGNLDRAEALVPTQSRESLDLTLFAAEFAAEISGGQATLVPTEGEAAPIGATVPANLPTGVDSVHGTVPPPTIGSLMPSLGASAEAAVTTTGNSEKEPTVASLSGSSGRD